MTKYEAFGQVAVRMDFCSQDDITKALEIQKNLSLEGKEHRLIGLILLELGALSTTQLIQILQYYDLGTKVPDLDDREAAQA
jgi:hypothetical protein